MLAGMNVNVWDVTEPIQQLIRSARWTRRPWRTRRFRWTPCSDPAAPGRPASTGARAACARRRPVPDAGPPVDFTRGRQDQRRGREGGTGRGPDRRRRVRVPPAAQRGRRQPQGPVPLPRREVPVLPGQPEQGPLPLLRLPGGRRHHRLRDEGRPPHLLGDGRAPRRPGGHHPAVRGGRLQPRPTSAASASAWSRPTRSPPSSTSSSSRRPRGRDRPQVPRRARLRPGGRRALRRRLQPRGLGPPHPLPARQGLHRQGAHPLRPLPGGPPRPHRPLPRPADVADPRHRAARSSASAPASCATTTTARSTSTPPTPRSTRSPRCSTASTSRRRTSPRPAARSSSRATPTSWPATSPGSPPPSPPAAPPSAATTSRSSAGC